MLTRRLVRSFQKLLRLALRLPRIVIKKTMTWLLRGLLARGHRRQFAKAGFVLPTTVLLTLVVALVIGGLTFRTYTRTAQVIGYRQQQVIYNAATPAIDRAKAKLEFMFNRDNDYRLPSGVPGESTLLAMMKNDASAAGIGKFVNEDGQEVDPYTLPGEERLTQNDKELNAWEYRTDTDGDGTEDATVVYSILFETPKAADDPRLEDSTATAIAQRAQKFMVRNGPVTDTGALNPACAREAFGGIEEGWFRGEDANLRKNFQVNAVVIPDSETNRSISTIEFQQDRKLIQSKWGAWFRYDMEVAPGEDFNWNGSMHSEGTIFLGEGNKFRAYLVSSPASCLDIRESSTISATQLDGFQGQLMAGRVGAGTVEAKDKVVIDLYDPTKPATPIQKTLDQNGDSATTGSTIDVSLKPDVLFTEDRNEARGTDETNKTNRDGTWEASDFVTKFRMRNRAETPPFVDDSYRADNRWGPKPEYDDKNVIPAGSKIGAAITDTKLTSNSAQDTGSADELRKTQFGLDGYWERRATAQGLKIIVGQRLELGNTFGWKGAYHSNTDPVYPPGGASGYPASRVHETLQRKTLHDNLAAVQSAAVYHYLHENGEFPIACLASTAHHGTPDAIGLSKDFRAPEGFSNLYSNFFSGKGTNGLEYATPTKAAVTSAVNSSTTELGKALRNLAYFAGDPLGGAPSYTPAQGTNGVPHPFPYMSMWGDFSMLRRIFEAGKSYEQLSLADKTYVQTAACTLGMLAKNIHVLESYDPFVANASQTSSLSLTNLGQAIWNLMDGNVNNGEVLPKSKLSTYGKSESGSYSAKDYNPDDYNGLSPIDLANALMQQNASQGRFLASIVIGQQVRRDRTYGFLEKRLTLPGLTEIPLTSNYTIKVSGEDKLLTSAHLSCSPETFNSYVTGSGAGLIEKKVGLTKVFCNPEASKPRYPSLYYLFPYFNHDHDGRDATGLSAAEASDYERNRARDHRQPSSELYINASTELPATGLASANYIAVKNANADELGPYKGFATLDEINTIALAPRTTAPSHTTMSATAWFTPADVSGSSGSTAANNDPFRICAPTATGAPGTTCGTYWYVPFLDKVIYDGREMMAVRVLDIDLNRLRKSPFVSGTRQDSWLPETGIIYAFREDAVREDAIVRDSGTSMNLTAAATPTDPAIASPNGITTKPVDYLPDPARRPYGFRLRNGKKLRRTVPLNVATDVNRLGISFVTDNTVYVQGDFNLHQTQATDDTAGTALEEFKGTDLIKDDFSNFYTRTDLDSRFSRPTTDEWRPAEFLADAVTILSTNFCDGSAADFKYYSGAITIAAAQYNTTAFDYCAGTRTSFVNANLPSNTSATSLLHEGSKIDGTSGGNPALPYLMNRNAQLYLANGAALPHGDFNTFIGGAGGKKQDNQLQTAVETRTNAVIVSGIVPTRQRQSNGGLHNFPRLLENWDGRKLHIAGSFIQLAFSVYATAPYVQRDWEPGALTTNASVKEMWAYYGAPNRRWGYDVGLQYGAPSPISSRFTTIEPIRSEFYDEPPVNDPYIEQLCELAGKQCF